jgi:hypothetical protein
MSHWSRVLRRLHKRRKTDHVACDIPDVAPVPHPGPITRDAAVLRVLNRKLTMDRPRHQSHHTASSTDSSQRWATADEGPSHSDPSWGANFWVTIIDPQTQNHFYACPATGECSWDPPAGHFV